MASNAGRLANAALPLCIEPNQRMAGLLQNIANLTEHRELTSLERVHRSFRKRSIVLDLRAAQRRAIARDQHQFSCGRPNDRSEPFRAPSRNNFRFDFQTCRSAAQQEPRPHRQYQMAQDSVYLCLAAGTLVGRLDVRSRGAVPLLAGGQPPAPPDWHRS